jgi:hypothetical protein
MKLEISFAHSEQPVTLRCPESVQRKFSSYGIRRCKFRQATPDRGKENTAIQNAMSKFMSSFKVSRFLDKYFNAFLLYFMQATFSAHLILSNFCQTNNITSAVKMNSLSSFFRSLTSVYLLTQLKGCLLHLITLSNTYTLTHTYTHTHTR